VERDEKKNQRRGEDGGLKSEDSVWPQKVSSEHGGSRMEGKFGKYKNGTERFLKKEDKGFPFRGNEEKKSRVKKEG